MESFDAKTVVAGPVYKSVVNIVTSEKPVNSVEISDYCASSDGVIWRSIYLFLFFNRLYIQLLLARFRRFIF